VTIFDLLFLLAVLASAATFAYVVVSLVRRRRAQALRILRVYSGTVLLYVVAGLTISFLKPQRVIPIGAPWCFDDWCLTVQRLEQTPGPSATSYSVGFRIFSRARRVSQRAKGAWIYLIDERGHLYPPESDPSVVPLDALLHPLESVQTSRVFKVPNGSHPVGLITGHGGSYCGPMTFLIIGESGCAFKKPTMIALP